jgi:lupus La protein
MDDEAAPRSVYLGGCAKHLDVARLRASLEGCAAAAGFLPIVSIRRLRDLKVDRSYSGQVFVECDGAEKAQALLQAANKNACGVACTKAKLLKDFFDRQHSTMLEQRAKRAAAGSSGERKRPRGPEAEESAEARAEREAREAAQAEAERMLVLRFEGAGEGADREAVDAAVRPHAKLAFIDFARGEVNGHVRFDTAEGCKAALDALSAPGADAAVGGAVPTWRLLTAQEAAEYWDAYRTHAKQAKRQKGGGKGGGKGKGKGGGKGGHRGGGRGGGGGS